MRLLPLSLLACASLAACGASPWQRMNDAWRPDALLDAYLIAHGMAASYATSPGARPEVVVQLRTLDIKAARSIRALTQKPSSNVEATAEAVAALTDYAARQAVKNQ